MSEPGSGVNNRQVKLSRGKFLGGSSGVNGTLCIRGSRQDYDDWGLPGWSGDEFFKYMSKVSEQTPLFTIFNRRESLSNQAMCAKQAESFKSKPWFKPVESEHGYTGHLGTEPHDLAPISDLILESFSDKGLGLDHDMFTHGNNPHGCGHATRTVTNGLRTTGADFITNKNKTENVEVVCGAHVDKVLLEKDANGDLVATGVRAILSDGSVFEAKATKEVIVSGGAYCSPNILNRSGIGARDELSRHGIETLVDLPAVGKNLMDHLIVFMFYETDKPGITNDYLVYHGPDAFAKTYQLWKDEKKGFLSTFPFGAFAFARLDERLKDSEVWNKAPRKEGRDPMGLTPRQPNIEFFTTECYGGPKQFDQFPSEGQHAFSMIAELFGPKSRGTVTLRSADPLATPVVDCGYLTDPLDVEVLAEACRFGNEIVMEGKGTKDIVKGSWPPHLKHHTFKTREDWVPYVRENATTCYHASGTCAMGKVDDEKAVVDPELRVKGVKGLRVADCSIMPILHGGHTQMPAYGIGEKAADLIKGAWGLRSKVY